MAPLIQALFHAGPALIRLFGDAKGGDTGETANKIATVMEAVSGQPVEQRQQSLQHAIDSLPPEQVLQLKVGLAEIEASKQRSVLEHDLGMHRAQQETLRSTDIKGVRPTIANRHSWLTGAYLIGFEAAAVAGYGTGASWEIATLLASPTLAWFGFRTWDKFSSQGASH